MATKILALSLFIALAWGSFLPDKDSSQLIQPFTVNDFRNEHEQETHLTFNLEDSAYVEKNVYYYLYTREYPKAYRLVKNNTDLLLKSTFETSRPTKVLVHGFMNSYLNDMEQDILTAYLYNQDVNVVAVDWEKLAGSLLRYDLAASYTLPVGMQIAEMIDFMVTAGNANLSTFHLIGHSLGAHVVSFAANYITTGNITRISGLDPALPNFQNVSPDKRLDPSDADLVDCIHTCGGLYGYLTPLCTMDFYPNRGIPVQPGCWFLHLVGVCSHGRAFELFAASINITFEAQYCETFAEVEEKSCTGNTTGLMGDPAPTSLPGLYYLRTTGSYPYVKNSSKVDLLSNKDVEK